MGVGVYFTLEETAQQISKVVTPFHLLPTMYELHLGLKQYPVIFIYISQITNNVDHLFMNLLAICMSVLAKLLSFFELSFYY